MNRQPKPRNSEAERERERAENAVFTLTRAAQDLELIELRVKQALREGARKDLLRPALEMIRQTQERINRARG